MSDVEKTLGNCPPPPCCSYAFHVSCCDIRRRMALWRFAIFSNTHSLSHTHTYIYTHTHTHTYMQACAHAPCVSLPHRRTNSMCWIRCAEWHFAMYTHTCTHTYTHTKTFCNVLDVLKYAMYLTWEFDVQNDILQCIHTHARRHTHIQRRFAMYSMCWSTQCIWCENSMCRMTFCNVYTHMHAHIHTYKDVLQCIRCSEVRHAFDVRIRCAEWHFAMYTHTCTHTYTHTMTFCNVFDGLKYAMYLMWEFHVLTDALQCLRCTEGRNVFDVRIWCAQWCFAMFAMCWMTQSIRCENSMCSMTFWNIFSLPTRRKNSMCWTTFCNVFKRTHSLSHTHRTHTYTHKHTHAHTHAHTHTHIHTYTHIPWVHTRTHTYTHTYTYTRTHTNH